ncbi:MAG: YjiG family protein [Saezia sp.]
MSEQKTQVVIKKTPFDIFVDGAKKGWAVGIGSIIPNVMMAFILIYILKLTGLLEMIGVLFKPVMGAFGLPGEAVTVLLAAWMSMGGGTAVAATLFLEGTLSITHLAILLPAIYIMGSQVQYLGRVLGTMGVKGRYYGIMILISVVNAFLSLWVMNILVR